MAEDRAGAAGEDRGGGAGDWFGAGVPDGVDASVDGDEAAAGQPLADLVRRQPQLQELLARDVAVLPGSEEGDPVILWNA